MREIKVKEASTILGISELSLRCGLREGKLPIGTAWKNAGSTCWIYLISAQQLANFLGTSRDDILARVRDLRN